MTKPKVHNGAPEYLFRQIVRVAYGRPAPEHLWDYDHDVRTELWRDNLRLLVDQVANEAFVQGSQWMMERQTEAKYIVVTPEQYEALKEQASGEQA